MSERFPGEVGPVVVALEEPDAKGPDTDPAQLAPSPDKQEVAVEDAMPEAPLPEAELTEPPSSPPPEGAGEEPPPPPTWGDWFRAELLSLEKTAAAVVITLLVVGVFNMGAGTSKSMEAMGVDSTVGSEESLMTDQAVPVGSGEKGEPAAPGESTELSASGPLPDMNTGDEVPSERGEPAPPLMEGAVPGDTGDLPDRSSLSPPTKKTPPGGADGSGGGSGGGGDDLGPLAPGEPPAGDDLKDDVDLASSADMAKESDESKGRETSSPVEPAALDTREESVVSATRGTEVPDAGMGSSFRGLMDVKDILEIFIIVRAFFLLNIKRMLGLQAASPYAAGAQGYGDWQGSYGYQQSGGQQGYAQQQYPQQYQQRYQPRPAAQQQYQQQYQQPYRRT